MNRRRRPGPPKLGRLRPRRRRVMPLRLFPCRVCHRTTREGGLLRVEHDGAHLRYVFVHMNCRLAQRRHPIRRRR